MIDVTPNLMMVNGLISETLSSENRIAKLYNVLALHSVDRHPIIIKTFNKLINKNNQQLVK